MVFVGVFVELFWCLVVMLVGFGDGWCGGVVWLV